MDEILCLEKFEGADVKYHSKEVFSGSSRFKVGPKFWKVFFTRNTTFWQIEGGEVKHVNSFFQVPA